MHHCAIVLPAAGSSSRMRGTDKLLQKVAGHPLLRLVALRATQASAHVAVTLPPDARARAQALDGLPLTQLAVAAASEGMAASLREAANWATRIGAQALMIALPDMPDISADDMRTLIRAQRQHPKEPLRACTPSRRAGHPVIMPHALFADMMRLTGDAGARALLQVHPPRLHPLPGVRALTDLDTPEDWATWLAGQEGRHS